MKHELPKNSSKEEVKNKRRALGNDPVLRELYSRDFDEVDSEFTQSISDSAFKLAVLKAIWVSMRTIEK